MSQTKFLANCSIVSHLTNWGCVKEQSSSPGTYTTDNTFYWIKVHFLVSLVPLMTLPMCPKARLFSSLTWTWWCLESSLIWTWDFSYVKREWSRWAMTVLHILYCWLPVTCMISLWCFKMNFGLENTSKQSKNMWETPQNEFKHAQTNQVFF